MVSSPSYDPNLLASHNPEDQAQAWQRLRDDPDRYRELKRQWHDFMKLPAERRKRLEAIDEELDQEREVHVFV